MVAAGQPGHAIDAQALDHHQRDHARDDDAPVLGHHLQVQRHAHAQEEEAQQQTTERLDVGFQLVAEARFGQQHAGHEGAHGHGQAAHFHQQAGAQHHQQRGRGHDFPSAAGGQHAEQGVEHPEARGHQGAQAEQGDADGLPQRCRVCGAIGRAGCQEFHDGQQRHDQQVLEQQDGDDALTARRGQLLPLAQHLHDDGGGGEHEAGGADEGHRPRGPEQGADDGEQDGADDDLQAAQAEDLPTQAPQVRGLHLQTDDEQEHHHPEFGNVDDGVRIGDQGQTVGADGQAGGQVAEHRAQAQSLEEGHGHDGGAQQGDDLDEVERGTFCCHETGSRREEAPRASGTGGEEEGRW